MPPADSTSEFLRALEETGFLSADQLHALKDWMQIQNPDVQAMARELNKRGWLTSFQIKEIFRGRGKQLVIGPYRILDLVGEGGMGRVFRALHTRLGREVALKVIRREKLASPMTVRRFRQEIQAVAHLSHPNVVLAFDADEAGGDHYLAMEFVDGTDLTKIVRERGPLPIRVACDYVRQAALGLHHAFERGLVHRDVKPSNLIASKAGQVKVLDLGLAMLNEGLGSESATRVTQEGFVIGTPDFLAPEQAQNPLHVDTRADVYSLGATLYYLLTGKVPYEGANPTEKLMKHVSDPPPSLLKHLPNAPLQLDQLIQWMMAKDPNVRPQTPLQAAVALAPFAAPHTGIASQTPQDYPIPLMPPFDPAGSSQVFRLPQSEAPARVRERIRDKRSRTGWLIGIVAVVAAGVLAFVLVQLAIMPDPAPDKEYTNPLGMKFVLIKPGSFKMGSPDSEPGRGVEEGPVGDVTLESEYYMGATEVTSGQYQQLLGKSPAWTAGRVRGGSDWPVEQVSWKDAQSFCKKLNERDRSRRRGWDYRLPTEAEWEYACRGRTETPYSFGTELTPESGETFRQQEPDPVEEEVKPRPAPQPMPSKVGQSKPNPFGLFDMHGNVAEWCQDYYSRGYPEGARSNPTGPANGDLRSVRGGSFDVPANKCRSASRRGLQPELQDRNVGFRVVLARVP